MESLRRAPPVAGSDDSSKAKPSAPRTEERKGAKAMDKRDSSKGARGDVGSVEKPPTSYAMAAKQPATEKPVTRMAKERVRSKSLSKNARQKRTERRARDKKKARGRVVLPAFIVGAVEGETPKQQELWTLVSSSTRRPRIDTCKRLANGDLLLRTGDEETAKALRDLKKDPKVNIREPGPFRPRVVVHNIPSDYERDFIDSSIMGQNAAMESLDLGSFRAMSKWGPRGRETTSWVIEASPNAYKAMVHRRMYIGMVSVFPRPFESAGHCSKCLDFGHKTGQCKKEPVCIHCAASGHVRKDCPIKKEQPRCCYCGGRHAALTDDCKTWVSRVNAIRRLTSYD